MYDFMYRDPEMDITKYGRDQVWKNEIFDPIL